MRELQMCKKGQTIKVTNQEEKMSQGYELAGNSQKTKQKKT